MPSFNGAFLRVNLHRINDGAYLKNLDDKQSKGTHWVSLFIDKNTAVYFNLFRIEELLNKVKDKSVTHIIFKIQDNESIMCVYRFHRIYACRKKVVGLHRLFFPNDCKTNDKINYEYFKDKYSKRNLNPWP